jgi:hypothetical protein
MSVDVPGPPKQSTAVMFEAATVPVLKKTP